MPAIVNSFIAKANKDTPHWPDLDRERCIHLGKDAPPIHVATLEGGMTSGLPSVALRVDLPDGQTVIAETSARLFCASARAIMAKYPALFDD
jgi:hypothetical protein